ncbi:MAG: flagellar basal-body MS-ring/collar protein FliF [Bacillota bacterium]
MIEKFKQLIEQLKSLWNNLDTKPKIIIISAVVVVIISLFLITKWASRPNYVTLFNDLNMKDAGEITKQLEEKQVNYKLANEGSKILVPKEEVHQARLDLASQGLPGRGAVGFELFDRSQLGSTNFEQQVNFYRALSGELSRTIMHLEKIDFAKVQISAPRESLYLDKEKKVKASVMLKLGNYSQLELDQVRAITNLVANSVEDLKPGNVSVVDNKGNLLSAKLDRENKKDNLDFNPELLEVESKFEDRLESSLNTMLTKVLGPDNVVVRVNANLNFDQREVTNKTYEPVNDDEGIVRSEKSKEVSHQGTGDAEGAPGTESNIPDYQGTEEGNSNYSKEESTVNYEINEQIENHSQAPGEVENISVSVMVDQEDLTAEQEESIRNSVASAVGYDQERGDQITITNFEFDSSVENELNAAMEANQTAQWRRWLIIGGIFLVALIVGILLIRRLQGGGSGTDVNQAESEELDVIIDDQGQTETAATKEELSPEEKKRKERKEELTELVREEPEEVARLLKSWLAEE